MNEARQSELDKYLLGVTLMIALIFGGGTQTGLTTDTAVQLLAAVTATIVCVRCMNRQIDRRVFWFLLLAALAIVAQLLPIGVGFLHETQGILPEGLPIAGLEPLSISLGFGRTLEVLTYFLTVGLFLVAVLKLRFDQMYGLLAFFFVGVVLNLAVGLVQYSYAGRAVVSDWFSYPLKAGFFVNVNHYSSLVFVSIPLAFVYFIENNRLILLSLYLVTALLILLAAGSTAGVLVGLAITLLSGLFLFQHNRFGLVSTLVGTIILGIYTAGVWARLQVEEVNTGYGRLEFARTTLEGIRDNLPFGIGYGNFVIAYPGYEKPDMIFNTYVNHAHNDYLELLFEGGFAAALLMIAFLLLFAHRAFKTMHLPLHKAATLSILFLLIHSVVDYPLRTLALALSFALFLGILFHRGPEKSNAAPAGEAHVNLNGETVSVPLTG